MKLYIADYLGDTHHLSRGEHGAYLLLLMSLWRAGGKLPNDPSKLARLAKCTADEWAEVGPVVMDFFTIRGAVVVQKRASAEIAKYTATVKGSKEAGKESGRKRANKNNDVAGNVRSENVEQKSNQPEPELELEGSKSSEDKSSAQILPLVVDVDAEAWKAVLVVMSQGGKTSEPEARKFFGKLLSANGLKAGAMLPALSAAMVNRTQDPKGYLTKAAAGVATRSTPVGEPKRQSFV